MLIITVIMYIIVYTPIHNVCRYELTSTRAKWKSYTFFRSDSRFKFLCLFLDVTFILANLIFIINAEFPLLRGISVSNFQIKTSETFFFCLFSASPYTRNDRVRQYMNLIIKRKKKERFKSDEMRVKRMTGESREGANMQRDWMEFLCSLSRW